MKHWIECECLESLNHSQEHVEALKRRNLQKKMEFSEGRQRGINGMYGCFVSHDCARTRFESSSNSMQIQNVLRISYMQYARQDYSRTVSSLSYRF